MSREQYYSKMKPYADRAAQSLGIPVSVILAQWSLETGSGTSAAAKNNNNHAGIKSNSLGSEYNGGTYAGYRSLDGFVKDYIRVMNLSYYDKVRAAGNNVDAVVRALDASPWAEDKQYGNKIMSIIKGTPVTGIGSGGSSSGNITLPQNVLKLGDIVGQVNTASPEQLKQWAVIGLGAVMLAALVGK